MKHVGWMLVLLALLMACGEKPQTLETPGTGQRDAAPFSGTGKAFVDEGWKQGDKASWESHMKARTQQGQNDYARIN